MAVRTGDWKLVFEVQRAFQMNVWAEAYGEATASAYLQPAPRSLRARRLQLQHLFLIGWSITYPSFTNARQSLRPRSKTSVKVSASARRRLP